MSLLRLNIPVVDDELRGIPSGSLVVIEGSPLSYADVMARLLLANRAHSGERVVYFLVDDDVEDVRDSMLALGLRIQTLEVSGAWTFISRSNESLQDLFTSLLNDVKQGSSSCIDTFSSFVAHTCKDDNEVVEVLHRLRSVSKVGGGLHILVVVPTMHTARQLDMIRSKVDAVMKVSYKESGNSYVRYLKIVKVKRKPHQGIVVPFTITKSGVVFEFVTRIV
ncbi:MAG: ATPase domain-containing protein [Candidatus Nezhaarchaeales archaeon]